MKTILFSLIIVFVAIPAFAQKSSIAREKLDCPMDFWEISSMLGSFLGLKDAPAKIVATGDPDLRSGFKEVSLKNLSGKTITAVKIKWFIYRVDRTDNVIKARANPNIILQNETPSIKTGELEANEEKWIEYPISSCREIYDALVEDGETTGEPWIEPAVSEISYADGSKWTR